VNKKWLRKEFFYLLFLCPSKSSQLFSHAVLNIYSKPSLIRLQFIQMLDNMDQNIKNEKCCSQWGTYLKRHTEFTKADESLVCSEKTGQFLQTCIITFKNEYKFWVFCWWVYFFFIVFNLKLCSYIFFISTTYIIKFSIYLFPKFFVF
jgi:hypothetical protein